MSQRWAENVQRHARHTCVKLFVLSVFFFSDLGILKCHGPPNQFKTISWGNFKITPLEINSHEMFLGSHFYPQTSQPRRLNKACCRMTPHN